MKKSKFTTATVDFGTKKSNPRGNTKITKITPHHMAAKSGAVNCAKYHLNTTERTASANYYIKDDDIVVGVSEDRRAWTSSSKANDMAAITIEVSNSTTSPDWKISDKSYQSLVKLCADICLRYGITPHYDGTKNGSITMHKMFGKTTCPGPYLEKLITSRRFEMDIQQKINEMRYEEDKNQYEKQNQNQIPVTGSAADKVEPKTTEYKVTAIHGLKLRNGAGKSFTEIMVMPYGKTFTVDSTKNGWAHGTYKGTFGWASLTYLKKV